MDALPAMTSDRVTDPIAVLDGVLCLRLDGDILPLRLGQEPVTAFVPGWRAVSVYTGFHPFSILQFNSENGETAFWIVDAEGSRLGGSLGEMDPSARAALRAAATPRVADLVSAVLQPPLLALDDPSRAFLLLPEDLRRDIGRLCATAALPPAARVVLDAAPDQWDGECGLSRMHVEALLAMPFQDRLLLVAQDGMLSWPSPVDGRTLAVQGSLCSDDFRFAYRLVDAVHDLVVYPIVSHHHSTTLGLYVPALNMVAIRDGWAAGWFNVYVPDLAEWLVPLICRFGPMLGEYFRSGAGWVASIMRSWPAVHLGHQLWNELTGIDWFLRSAAGPYLPKWIVPGAETELWGRIDEIFPQIEGRVERSAINADTAIASSYTSGACLVRITSEYVSADLRGSLHRSVEADPTYGEVRQIITSRTRPNAPVILLGLRVENRTIIDLLDFCEELLEHVSDTFPGAIIVVDGHNSGSNGQIIVSHGERMGNRSPLAAERQIATHLKRLQMGRDVTVVDTLGMPVRTSLAWCRHAHCFFSIWGASLSKYRWACNTPGLVITSHWNMLIRDDLHIYKSPKFMEAPTDLKFVSEDVTVDMPDAPQLIDVGPGQPAFYNFHTDNQHVFRQFVGVVQDAMANLSIT